MERASTSRIDGQPASRLEALKEGGRRIHPPTHAPAIASRLRRFFRRRRPNAAVGAARSFDVGERQPPAGNEVDLGVVGRSTVDRARVSGSRLKRAAPRRDRNDAIIVAPPPMAPNKRASRTAAPDRGRDALAASLADAQSTRICARAQGTPRT
jgi:hypothetical protein